jgi:phospholipid/cholesterol/gamma-HCH transport system ATP-binding protein
MTLPGIMAVERAPAIQFANVHIGFEEGEILRGLSFSVMPGDTLILLGETGMGKTLSLKIAAGLLRPTAGHATVLGKNLEIMEEKELLGFRREIGFVFQEGALFDSMTVADNVAYRLREEHLDEDQIAPRVHEALQFVELEHTLDMLPSELSGGMRRRVSIARALINRPPIVLYDSPTAGLDPVTSQTIITLILRLRDIYGVTSLLATHRLQDGFAMANFRFDPAARRVVSDAAVTADKQTSSVTRFVVLRDGVVYFEGEPEELAETRDPYLQRFLI